MKLLKIDKNKFIPYILLIGILGSININPQSFFISEISWIALYNDISPHRIFNIVRFFGPIIFLIILTIYNFDKVKELKFKDIPIPIILIIVFFLFLFFKSVHKFTPLNLYFIIYFEIIFFSIILNFYSKEFTLRLLVFLLSTYIFIALVLIIIGLFPEPQKFFDMRSLTPFNLNTIFLGNATPRTTGISRILAILFPLLYFYNSKKPNKLLSIFLLIVPFLIFSLQSRLAFMAFLISILFINIFINEFKMKRFFNDLIKYIIIPITFFFIFGLIGQNNKKNANHESFLIDKQKIQKLEKNDLSTLIAQSTKLKKEIIIVRKDIQGLINNSDLSLKKQKLQRELAVKADSIYQKISFLEIAITTAQLSKYKKKLSNINHDIETNKIILNRLKRKINKKLITEMEIEHSKKKIDEMMVLQQKINIIKKEKDILLQKILVTKLDKEEKMNALYEINYDIQIVPRIQAINDNRIVNLIKPNTMDDFSIDNLTTGRSGIWGFVIKDFMNSKNKISYGHGVMSDRNGPLEQSISNAFFYALFSNGIIGALSYILLVLYLLIRFIKYLTDKKNFLKIDGYMYVILTIIFLRSIVENSFYSQNIDLLILLICSQILNKNKNKKLKFFKF